MDDHLAVHNDANSLRSGKQKIPAISLQATGQEQTGVGRTQSIPMKSLMYAVARIGVFNIQYLKHSFGQVTTQRPLYMYKHAGVGAPGLRATALRGAEHRTHF